MVSFHGFVSLISIKYGEVLKSYSSDFSVVPPKNKRLKQQKTHPDL